MSVLSTITPDQYQLKGIQAKKIQNKMVELNSYTDQITKVLNDCFYVPILKQYPVLQEIQEGEILEAKFDAEYKQKPSQTDKLVYMLGKTIYLANNLESEIKKTLTQKSKESIKSKIRETHKLQQKYMSFLCSFDGDLATIIENKVDEYATKLEPAKIKRENLEIEVITMVCEVLGIDENELLPEEMDEIMANIEKYNQWFIDFFTLRAKANAQNKKEKEEI